MVKLGAEFEVQLNRFEELFLSDLPSDFEIKTDENVWSKKEIIGHLIDSALNNLKRFTEIQYFEKPYIVLPYNQDELVKANNYQQKNTADLFRLLIALNRQIVFLMKNQTEQSLKYKVVLPNQNEADLHFLMVDYIAHFYHHLKQIDSKWRQD